MSLSNQSHIAVLQEEVLERLVTSETKTVFDGTLGLGGHAERILTHFPQIEAYIGVDLDEQHLSFAQKRLDKWRDKGHYFCRNFSDIAAIVAEVSPNRPLTILLDLGVCSNQLDDKSKGFSFRKDGPLNMSFGKKAAINCEELLNEGTVDSLRTILREYGEEPFAHEIAHNIVSSRKHKALKTTKDLRAIIEANVPASALNKTLMRVFQALRIATNDELGHLKKVLASACLVMKSGDRIGVMSFHSLEDRIVKQFFKKITQPKTRATARSLHEVVAPAPFRLLTKKPIKPTEIETKANARARSVTFRIAEKI